MDCCRCCRLCDVGNSSQREMMNTNLSIYIRLTLFVILGVLSAITPYERFRYYSVGKVMTPFQFDSFHWLLLLFGGLAFASIMFKVIQKGACAYGGIIKGFKFFIKGFLLLYTLMAVVFPIVYQAMAYSDYWILKTIEFYLFTGLFLVYTFFNLRFISKEIDS